MIVLSNILRNMIVSLRLSIRTSRGRKSFRDFHFLKLKALKKKRTYIVTMLFKLMAREKYMKHELDYNNRSN